MVPLPFSKPRSVGTLMAEALASWSCVSPLDRRSRDKIGRVRMSGFLSVIRQKIERNYDTFKPCAIAPESIPLTAEIPTNAAKADAIHPEPRRTAHGATIVTAGQPQCRWRQWCHPIAQPSL